MRWRFACSCKGCQAKSLGNLEKCRCADWHSSDYRHYRDVNRLEVSLYWLLLTLGEKYAALHHIPSHHCHFWRRKVRYLLWMRLWKQGFATVKPFWRDFISWSPVFCLFHISKLQFGSLDGLQTHSCIMQWNSKSWGVQICSVSKIQCQFPGICSAFETTRSVQALQQGLLLSAETW